ncbi:MAG: ADP-dependent glucokinase/phosphofructokinase [Caldilineaceae bacterium]
MQEKIALGFGGCIDYEIVWDATAIEALIHHYGIHAAELDINQIIQSERDLVISILSFLQAGIGGERFVRASAIIEQFARHFAKKITLGGTSVRATIAMRKLGYTSALHLVTINEHFRRLLPLDCPIICSNSQESAHPHLIVQFGQGACINAGDIDLCASRSNRIIYHHDDDNIRMDLNEDFANLMSDAKVFLISGFNAMQSEELLLNRLAAVLRMLEKLPQAAQVYFEDAVYYNPRFHQLILATLAQQITIFSLNEDELQAHLGRKLNLLDAEQIKAALADLQKIIPVPILVLHSMYWALAYGQTASRMAQALKGGVTMATTRFRYGDDFTVENYHSVGKLAPNPAGARFCEALTELLGDQVCCVPVAQVAQANATTIGLGDAFVGGFLPALVG